MSDFAARVRYERARLAFEDAEGEGEAVAPLAHDHARRIVVGAEDRAYQRATHRQADPRDPRDLLERLGADPSRDHGRVPCPAHGGRDSNLAWRIADGRVLVKCHSHQCTFGEIVAAVR